MLHFADFTDPHRCLVEIAISSSFRWIVAGLSPIG